MPTILYNIPSRTGCDIPDSVYYGFASHPMAYGVKEASGSISKCSFLSSEFGGNLPLYSGNDDMTLPVLALGGYGVISVVSNLYPYEMSRLCALYETDREECLKLFRAFNPLMRSLFTETNPCPIKSAMAKKGLCSGELRLPLTRASSGCEKRLFREMENFESNFLR